MKKHFFKHEGGWYYLADYAVHHNWFTDEYLILQEIEYKYKIIDRQSALFHALLTIKRYSKGQI